MATHSSNLAWRISWTEEPAELQSMRMQRVRHNVAINTFLFRKKTLDRQKTERSVKKKNRQNICPSSCSQKHVTGNTAHKKPIRTSSSGARLGRRAKPLPIIVG